jgi:hypothetical protein
MIKLLVTGSARLELPEKQVTLCLDVIFLFKCFHWAPEVIGNLSGIIEDESPFINGDL